LKVGGFALEVDLEAMTVSLVAKPTTHCQSPQQKTTNHNNKQIQGECLVPNDLPGFEAPFVNLNIGPP
jgi:hypothetical protein